MASSGPGIKCPMMLLAGNSHPELVQLIAKRLGIKLSEITVFHKTNRGLTHIITMDLHQKEIQAFFDISIENLRASPFLIDYIEQSIPDYRNAIIVARNPNSVKRATSYAERLRLGIAVIHGEDKIMEQDDGEDGRNSPPLPEAAAGSNVGMGFGLESLPVLQCKEKPPLSVVGDVSGRIAIIVVSGRIAIIVVSIVTCDVSGRIAIIVVSIVTCDMSGRIAIIVVSIVTCDVSGRIAIIVVSIVTCDVSGRIAIIVVSIVTCDVSGRIAIIVVSIVTCDVSGRIAIIVVSIVTCDIGWIAIIVVSIVTCDVSGRIAIIVVSIVTCDVSGRIAIIVVSIVTCDVSGRIAIIVASIVTCDVSGRIAIIVASIVTCDVSGRIAIIVVSIVTCDVSGRIAIIVVSIVTCDVSGRIAIIVASIVTCDASGRIAIIVDDMIDDVVSFVKIAEVLKDRGAYKVFVMATHGLLSSDAPRLIEESCIDEVVVTNTVPHEIQKMQCHKIKTVDISVMLSEAIRRIHNNESMSYLFRNIALED
ncbi:Phosphoribosyl pyrophosphate synthase-associated protein 2,Phosphoribosyl pyrophosphate synthase-associated protein 1 [Mytilus coruscus]|uniref:Phosphoribosyl pyrophosphate synthase-associated protein 2,Phosphoribosyl pyrophosphate synthase-associated protein 1 n=1 Tax=Mytilus coruscus TaxID=42192 RepID=A0A6J8ECN7_MYTCO|nr:Phosphoribosyl pyrophosphate synthase-associated protein 2,Phosphoribosyl pyrophosphate synthase-associated protein 1 [Mytilus coruscus]